MKTMDQVDEYVGLPLLEIAKEKIRTTHPRSVPFGPDPVKYITRTAATYLGLTNELKDD